MKRIVIICEGSTEREFCCKTLAPYLLPLGVSVEAPLIKASHGGIVKWARLKKQIECCLKNDPSAVVTTLIDYYGIYAKYQFPKWDECQKIANKIDMIGGLETAMREDIEDRIRYRFIPYMQLHEFEGLLFNDVDDFIRLIPEDELIGITELRDVMCAYPNPELINNSRETSPSRRLMRIIDGYHKVVYGNILAEEIGLSRIRAKCPRFNAWVSSLENI